MIALQSIALGTPVLLPDYYPIPEEVRSMCVVEKEEELDKMAARMLKGPKSRYIKDSSKMEQFYISKVNQFYTKLFDKIL
jgi:hypothetical protein